MPHFARILSRCNRGEIETLIGAAIELLDKFDGDPDLEANGDELDGNGGEDDFCAHDPDGPGCPIGDPDRGVDDDGEEEQIEDSFWLSLHTREAYAHSPGCPVSDDDEDTSRRPWQRDAYGRRLAMVKRRKKIG